MLDKSLSQVEANEQFNPSSKFNNYEQRNDIYNSTKNIESSLEYIQKDIDEISDKFRQVGTLKSNGEELAKIKYYNSETKTEQFFDVTIYYKYL